MSERLCRDLTEALAVPARRGRSIPAVGIGQGSIDLVNQELTRHRAEQTSIIRSRRRHGRAALAEAVFAVLVSMVSRKLVG
jgi:hypothetical protein